MRITSTVSGTRVSADIVQNCVRCTLRMIKILTFCSYQNMFIIGIALHTNDIKFLFHRCTLVEDLVLDKVVIAFAAKISNLSLCKFHRIAFCNKYAYLWFVDLLICFGMCAYYLQNKKDTFLMSWSIRSGRSTNISFGHYRLNGHSRLNYQTKFYRRYNPPFKRTFYWLSLHVSLVIFRFRTELITSVRCRGKQNVTLHVSADLAELPFLTLFNC